VIDRRTILRYGTTQRPCRIRIRYIPDAYLKSFVCDAVVPSSAVYTDGWGGYNTWVLT
jgi:hypothetical protein